MQQGRGFVRDGAALTAVLSTFVWGLPGDGGEGALEEGVVDDVTLAVFAFDDPVSGIGFALAGVGKDKGRVEALGGVHQERAAGAEAVHLIFLTLLSVVASADIYISAPCS